MTDHRPFLEWPLEQLAEHGSKHATHAEVLVRVLRELSCRPGRDARAVQRRLEAARSMAERGTANLNMANRSATFAGSPDMAEAALHRRLAIATEEVEALRLRLETSRSPAEADAAVSPHASLWLTPGAPEWLVIAARRAFRRHYHPDRHSGPERILAEARFKAAEEAFSKILRTQEFDEC